MKSIAKRLMAVLSVVIMLAAVFAPSFQASAASVKLNKKKLTIAVSQTYTLKLSGTKNTVTWKSSNRNVASVTKKGVVKGRKKGNATITAKVGKKTYTCKVTVEAPKLSATKKTVTAGTSFTLKLRGTNRTVRWSTSNKNVATVKKGTVKTLKKGTVKITAKVGGMSYVCNVTVKAKPASTSTAIDKATAAAQYNNLVNTLKKEQNLTVKLDETMKMSTDNVFVNSIMGDDLNEKSSATYRFTNGKSLQFTDSGSAYYVTVNGIIPPNGKDAALEKEHIKTATLTKNANGTSKLSITLVSETSTYNGKTLSETPAQNVAIDASVGSEFIDFSDMGLNVKKLNMTYPGTTLEATVGKDGKLTALVVTVPMKIDLSVSMDEVAGFDLDLKLNSNFKNAYTITY